MILPHSYQFDYLSAIADAQKEFKRILVVAPTGSGKTNLFSWIAEGFVKRGKRVLILADQDELCRQPMERLLNLTGIYATLEKAEYSANRNSLVTVGSVQTLMREKRLSQWPQNHFDLIICDEADKSIAASWQAVLKYFDANTVVIGFTATPHRTDKKNLGVYYEKVVENENLYSLIDKGYLSPIQIKMLPLNIDLSGASTRKGDYDENELDEIIAPHLEEFCKLLLIHAWDRRTLVFLPLIKTCEKFNVIARDCGLNADYIFGEDDDRDSKLIRFKRGEIDVMANSMLLTRGIDVPEVNCLAPLRPTKSITLYFQMVGRGTRLWPNVINGLTTDESRRVAIAASPKRNCMLIDCLYQSKRNLACRPARLIAKNDEEAEQITKLLENGGMPSDIAEQMDLMTVAAEASSQREKVLRRKLEENKNKSAQTISASDFAIKHGSLAAAEYEPTMAWEQQPITDKQRKYLSQAGIDLATVTGKGHASQLLSLHFADKQKHVKLASMAVRMKMKQMGHPNWSTATEQEGRKFFASLNKQPKEMAFL